MIQKSLSIYGESEASLLLTPTQQLCSSPQNQYQFLCDLPETVPGVFMQAEICMETVFSHVTFFLLKYSLKLFKISVRAAS